MTTEKITQSAETVDIEDWVDAVKNNPDMCVNSAQVQSATLIRAGFTPWPDENEVYENGFHQGMDANPANITAQIRNEFGDDVDIVFHVGETSQFYVKFKAFIRDNVEWETLSSNSFSHDMQLGDVVFFLEADSSHMDAWHELLKAFPEANLYTLDGSSHDWEFMGVDQEWSNWLTDWIEANIPDIQWIDGEPFLKVAK